MGGEKKRGIGGGDEGSGGGKGRKGWFLSLLPLQKTNFRIVKLKGHWVRKKRNLLQRRRH